MNFSRFFRPALFGFSVRSFRQNVNRFDLRPLFAVTGICVAHDKDEMRTPINPLAWKDVFDEGDGPEDDFVVIQPRDPVTGRFISKHQPRDDSGKFISRYEEEDMISLTSVTSILSLYQM